MATATLKSHPSRVSTLPKIGLGRVPLGRSLTLRVSLLITALIAAVLAVFLWATSRELERTVLRTGSERALAASTQLANVLAQNGARGLGELQRLAADPAVYQYLTTPTEDLAATVRERLKTLATATQPPVVLLTAAGERVLVITASSPMPAAAARVPLPSGVPSHTGIGPFETVGTVLFSSVVAEVRSPLDDAAPSGARARPLGYLIVRRVIQAGPNTEIVGRLVGIGATVAMGNRAGGAWTDFFHPIAAPPVETKRAGTATYRAANGEFRVGGLAVVDGTPWAVWIDFPRTLVLAPARAVLRRMVLLGLGIVFFAAFAVAWLSARLARPLHDLTLAAEAIAAGEYSRRVKTDRRDEIGRLGTAFNTMTDYVADAHRELEDRVQHRTARLEETQAELEHQVREFSVVNEELEAFTYSVSHDLRAPLRHVTGFAALMERSAASKLDADERRWLHTIADAGARMGRLIDDLLAFSRSGRTTLVNKRVPLEQVVREAQAELAADPRSADVTWVVAPLPDVEGDSAMLRLVFVNLIGNALKYTRNRPDPRIEIGVDRQPGEIVIFVRDNGVGFDMQYVDKLFGVFQRLHDVEDFEGTGIGLANVRRIVHRHGGRTWAEGVVDAGATFYFSLPDRL
jgi:signal transduction histidine kinase